MTTMTTTPLDEALTRIQIASEDREQRVPRVRHLIEFRHGDEVLAALESEAAPIHTPHQGDRLDLYGIPVTVTGVTVIYDTAPDGYGVVLAVVAVRAAKRPAVRPIPGMPSRISGAYDPNEEEPMSERVNVKVLLMVGGEAEVVADAPDADAPARYAASLIAEEVGVPASELPGMRLSAVVGADDRLSGWRRR
ncbi:hypothetical protein ACWDF9_08655 [Streptomyces rubiginosohelvolus]